MLDDDVPELASYLLITISSAGPQFYARPEPNGLTQVNITVEASDDPYGVFSFPAASLYRLLTEPASGTTPVTLTVQRSGGLQLSSTVTWTFVEASPGNDFATPFSGSLIFANGQTQRTFTVNLKADTIFEFAEFYHIKLTAATGRAVNDTAQLEIAPNGLAAGVLQLSAPYGTRGDEDASPYGNITVRVRRIGGSTGSVSGLLVLDNSASGVFTSTSKSFTMASGVTSVDVEFVLISDTVPEDEANYTLSLSFSSGGAAIDPSYNSLTLAVLASDNAYGVFSFTEDSLEFEVAEPAEVVLEVQREGGAFRTVTVPFTVTSVSGGGRVGQDITPASGSLTFAAGQRLANVTIEIPDDTLTEDDQLFQVTLGQPSLSGAVLSTNSTLVSSQLLVAANDALLSFAASSAVLREDDNSGISNGRTVLQTLTVRRTGTTRGPAQVSWRLVSGTAIFNQDFRGYNTSLDRGILTIRAGETNVSLNYLLIDDSVAEPREYFSVELSDAVGDVVLADPPYVNLTIEASDGAAGTVQLTAASRSDRYLLEGDTGTNVNFNVTLERLAAAVDVPLAGTVVAYWEIRNASNALAVDDFAATSGNVTFPDGVATVTLTLTLLDDTTPELPENFTLVISRVDYPALLTTTGAHRQALLVVNASDNPFGLVSLLSNSVLLTVGLSSTRVVNATVLRAKGTLGNINVGLRLAFSGASGTVLATSSVTMPAGATSLAVGLTINNDVVLELQQVLVFSLTSVQLSGAEASWPAASWAPVALTSPSAVDCSVPVSAARGIVSLSPNVARVEEPDSGSTSLTLTLSRVNGTYSRITVAWQLVNSTLGTNDISPFSGVVALRDGVFFDRFTLNVSFGRRFTREPIVGLKLIFWLRRGGIQFCKRQLGRLIRPFLQFFHFLFGACHCNFWRLPLYIRCTLNCGFSRASLFLFLHLLFPPLPHLPLLSSPAFSMSTAHPTDHCR